MQDYLKLTLNWPCRILSNRAIRKHHDGCIEEVVYKLDVNGFQVLQVHKIEEKMLKFKYNVSEDIGNHLRRISNQNLELAGAGQVILFATMLVYVS